MAQKFTDPSVFCQATRDQGEMPPFVLVTGSDPFLMVEASDQVRALARELGYVDREVIEMTPSGDWSRLQASMTSLGMFADKKLVDFRLPGGKAGQKGPKAITQALAQPYEGVCVLLSIPTPEWSTTKTQWWKTLTTQATVIDCQTPTRAQLPQWLAKRLAKQGQSASPAVLDNLADLLEGNLFAANQEILKLGLLYDARELTGDEIVQSVIDSSHYEMDALMESIELRQADRVLRILNGLEAQEAPLVLLISMLVREIRDLIKLSSAFAQGQSYVKGVFATPNKKAAARRFSGKRVKLLENALLVCAELDKQVKGLVVPTRDDNPWLELKSIAIFLAR